MISVGLAGRFFPVWSTVWWRKGSCGPAQWLGIGISIALLCYYICIWLYFMWLLIEYICDYVCTRILIHWIFDGIVCYVWIAFGEEELVAVGVKQDVWKPWSPTSSAKESSGKGKGGFCGKMRRWDFSSVAKSGGLYGVERMRRLCRWDFWGQGWKGLVFKHGSL